MTATANIPPHPDWVPEFNPQPPWWGGHLQTISTKGRRIPDLKSRFSMDEYVLPLNDGTDDALAGCLYQPDREKSTGERRSPLIVLLHGLGGTSQSSYIQSTANSLLQWGHRVMLIDFRGAGNSATHTTQLHHPGRTEDISALLESMNDETSRKLEQFGVVLVGYSLGGSVLLKFLAESGVQTTDHSVTEAVENPDHRPVDSLGGILGAVTVSAPLDLAATSKCLGRPSRWLYQKYLLRRMQRQSLAEDAELSEEERQTAASAKSVWEFDETLTAPKCGFETVHEYYQENSAGNKLGEIDVPTILVYALDDPFVPSQQYTERDWSKYPQLQPLMTPTGGHCGFRGKGLNGSWHDHCIDRFVDTLTSHSVS